MFEVYDAEPKELGAFVDEIEELIWNGWFCKVDAVKIGVLSEIGREVVE